MSSEKISQATLAAMKALDQTFGLPKYDYVLGFVMSESHVLLKESDVEWMEGAVNGYGGKVLPSDAGPEEAMNREFLEHTGTVDRGIDVEWIFLGIIRGPDYVIWVYSAYVPDIEMSFSDRMHELYGIDDLMDINCVYDVPELVAIASGQHGRCVQSEFLFVRRYDKASEWENHPDPLT